MAALQHLSQNAYETAAPLPSIPSAAQRRPIMVDVALVGPVLHRDVPRVWFPCSSSPHIAATCDPGCGPGTCYAPNKCRCPAGSVLNTETQNSCLQMDWGGLRHPYGILAIQLTHLTATCQEACFQGFCSAPNTCTCHATDFTRIQYYGPTCGGLQLM